MNKYTTVTCECKNTVFIKGRNYTVSILGLGEGSLTYQCSNCGKLYSQKEFNSLANEQYKEYIDGKKK